MRLTDPDVHSSGMVILSYDILDWDHGRRLVLGPGPRR